MNSKGTPSKHDFKGLGKAMIFAAWLILLGLLTLFFSGLLENQYNPNRHVESVVTAEGTTEVELQRNHYGHYVVDGEINGTKVRFLVDTGATDVAVPARLAERLGLQREGRVVSRTANGDVVSWRTRLDQVSVGAIRIHGVRASILSGMEGEEVLLGMSVLKQLELVQRGDVLTLRQTNHR